MKSYPVKIAKDAFDLVLFALDMEIVKKDIARQDMEEKGDVWEVDRYTYEIDGLKSFEQLLTKLIEMQK
jgi:CYTH domain-containing protein